MESKGFVRIAGTEDRFTVPYLDLSWDSFHEMFHLGNPYRVHLPDMPPDSTATREYDTIRSALEDLYLEPKSTMWKAAVQQVLEETDLWIERLDNQDCPRVYEVERVPCAQRGGKLRTMRVPSPEFRRLYGAYVLLIPLPTYHFMKDCDMAIGSRPLGLLSNMKANLEFALEDDWSYETLRFYGRSSALFFVSLMQRSMTYFVRTRLETDDGAEAVCSIEDADDLEYLTGASGMLLSRAGEEPDGAGGVPLFVLGRTVLGCLDRTHSVMSDLLFETPDIPRICEIRFSAVENDEIIVQEDGEELLRYILYSCMTLHATTDDLEVVFTDAEHPWVAETIGMMDFLRGI